MGSVQEQWMGLPEGQRAEIVNGVLHLVPNPGIRHAEVAGALFSELVDRHMRGRGGPGGWVFLFEPNVRVGEDIYEPDVAGWRVESYREGVSSDQIVAERIPDWVGEVLSPSTKRRDRAEKLPNYFRAGVGAVWLLHPLDDIVEAYERVPGGFQIAGTADLDGVVALPPFVPLDLSWARKVRG